MMNTVRYPAHRPAFTLVEMIMVVLVIAIASALAVPMLGQSNTQKLSNAAELLAADIAAAQLTTLAHPDAPRAVVFDTSNHRYHIALSTSTATPVTNTVGGVPYRVTFGSGSAAPLSGVTIQSISVGGDNHFIFGPFGQLDQASDATVTLACAGLTTTLTIDAVSGAVSIASP